MPVGVLVADGDARKSQTVDINHLEVDVGWVLKVFVYTPYRLAAKYQRVDHHTC